MVTLALLLGCRDFNNPSDPGADGYTVRSEAFLKRLGEAEPVAGDTVRLYGGVTSDAVEKAGLVAHYAWDLDGDGSTDTTVEGTDSLSLVLGDVEPDESERAVVPHPGEQVRNLPGLVGLGTHRDLG